MIISRWWLVVLACALYLIATEVFPHSEAEHAAEHAAEEPDPPVSTSDCVAGTMGSTLRMAKDAFAVACPHVPDRERDCDPIGAKGNDKPHRCVHGRIGVGGGTPTPENPGTPVQPPVVTPDPPVVNPPVASALMLQAESQAVRGTWRRTTDGIEYNGPNRYNINSRVDSENITYTVTVTDAGLYQFKMRARVANVYNAAEPGNDVWIKYGSVDWLKVFFPKFTQGWSENVKGDLNNVRNVQLMQSYLSAGTHTLTISGRSRGLEIDWLGVMRVGNGTPPVVEPPVTFGPTLPPTGPNVATNIGGSNQGAAPGGVGWMDSFQNQGRCFIDSNFDHGIGNVRVNTPQGNKTVREVYDAQQAAGAPSRRAGDPIYNDVQCGNGPANNAGDEDRADMCPGRVDQGNSGCRIIGPTWNLDLLFPAATQPNPNGLPVNGRIGADDLLSCHFDHRPDRDDGQAAPACLMVAEYFDLDLLVVTGAYGDQDRVFQDASYDVMNATFGNNGYLDAHRQYNASVGAAATRWLGPLNFGSDVWVAEGGQSDFTADVVREIKRRAPNIDTRNRIHVVQHSNWNENNTTDNDLTYVRNNTDYIRIEDGNHTNSTPNLNTTSDADAIYFRNKVFASQYKNAWEAAFIYYNPITRLDFSDNVGVLWMVGLEANTIANTREWVDYFL